MGRALIVVDVQNDFCPGGSLAVEGGDRVAADISAWLAGGIEHYDLVVPDHRWERPAVRALRELLAPGSALRGELESLGFRSPPEDS